MRNGPHYSPAEWPDSGRLALQPSDLQCWDDMLINHVCLYGFNKHKHNRQHIGHRLSKHVILGIWELYLVVAKVLQIIKAYVWV